MASAIRLAIVVALVVAFTSLVFACPFCEERAKVWAGVFDENFVATLLQVTLAVPLLILVGLAFLWADRLTFLAVGSEANSVASVPEPLRRGPLLAAGITLGIGLGGFLDGIFLHMLLRWHYLIAERIPPTNFVTLEINCFGTACSISACG